MEKKMETTSFSITLILVLIAGFFLTIILVAVSLIPTFIAVIRKHPLSQRIILVNIFLGWTVVGYILAMVWACSSIDRHDPQ